MKVLSLIALLIVLSLISTFNYYISAGHVSPGPAPYDGSPHLFDQELPDTETSVQYDVSAVLNPEEKKISVSSTISLATDDVISADTILFFLGLNNILANSGVDKTIKRRLITFSKFSISQIKVNGSPVELKYQDTDIEELPDSVIGYIVFNNSGIEENLLKITLEYEIKVLPQNPALGYASGKEFYYISNWLPHVILYAEKIRLNSAFIDKVINNAGLSDYSVDLTLPEGFKLISNGEVIDSTRKDLRNIYKVHSLNSSGITWIAAGEIETTRYNIELSDDQNLELNFFIQPENERYLERYRAAAVNTLSYLHKNFHNIPFETFSLVDIPQTSGSAYLASGNLITIKSEILSSKGLAEIEYYTAKMISKQFFKHTLNLKNSVNHWIVEGLSSLYANEIVCEYFEAPKMSFKFAYHYPVYGMNHLSFNDIPIVYSLIELEYDLGLKDLSKYYGDAAMGRINDCFYNYPDLNSYRNNKQIKPYLLLKSLIAKEGISNFNSLLKSNVFIDRSNYTASSQTKFINLLNKLGTTPLDQFFNHSTYVDYAVRSVEKIDNNKYKILAERLGDAVCSAKVVLHTEDGTIENFWKGEERFKYFTVVTDKSVEAAEIILTDTKYLDINFANNSFTLENQYWGSLSLAIRIFFWFQNAIMIFGSAA